MALGYVSSGVLTMYGLLENRLPRPLVEAGRGSEELSDGELLERIARVDADAMELLYRRYLPRISRFAQRMVSSPEMVEEIVNDVMYVVWRKASTFNGRGQPSTWIFGIAYRICLKQRGSLSADEHLSMDEAEDQLPGVSDGAMNALEADDWIRHLFAQLPPEQRAVLELTYHQDMNYRTIADILGCPENTVKTRMFHARKKIRALLQNSDCTDTMRMEG